MDSLLAQTDEDWDAVVVNDGSTDGTAAIIEDYARRDSRIRVFHKKNGGQPTALNKGLEYARGNWMCWLSSDDLFLPSKLARHRVSIEAHPTCRYFFTDSCVLDDAAGQILPSHTDYVPDDRWQVLDLLASNYISGISICAHHSLFEECGSFDETNRYGQDYDLHLRFLSKGVAVRIPEVTCYTRRHASQWVVLENRATFYDCASAAIKFLKNTSFDEIITNVAFDDESQVCAAVDRAIDVAVSSHAYVNQLGPHPLLLERIMEWVYGRSGDVGRKLQALVEWRVLTMANRCDLDSRWGGFWRAAALWVATNPKTPVLIPCTAYEVADAAFWEYSARGYAEAATLKRYIEKSQGREPHSPPSRRVVPRDMLVDGGVSEDCVKKLAREGWCITRIDSHADGLSLHEWGWNVGVRSARRSVATGLAMIPPWDIAILGRRNEASWAVASRAVPLVAESLSISIGDQLDKAVPAGWGVKLVRALRRMQGRGERMLKRRIHC